jgi:hypothetical protein
MCGSFPISGACFICSILAIKRFFRVRCWVTFPWSYLHGIPTNKLDHHLILNLDWRLWRYRDVLMGARLVDCLDIRLIHIRLVDLFQDII